MSVTFVSLSVSVVLTIGAIVTFVAFNFLSGGANFLFGKPRFGFLKSESGENGFSFFFRWSEDAEPMNVDYVRVRLFNPFGSPTQADVTNNFDPSRVTFGKDLDMGPGLSDLLGAKGLEKARVVVEVGSSKEGISYQFEYRGPDFMKKRRNALQTSSQWNEENQPKKTKPLFHQVSKSFIAELSPEAANKALKVATNPEYAGDFQDAGGAAAAGAENFSVSKVWIETGCIVCDACEGIYPEVFEVQEATCIVRPDYPKDNGILVAEAAEACPVEVIKFDRTK